MKGQDVDVHGEEHRPVGDCCDRSLDDLADPHIAHVVHEVRGDAVLPLPGELLFSRPVAAQPDLDVSACVDMAVADEPVHGRAVGVLHAEDLGAGVRVRVEVDEPDRAVVRGDRAHVRFGNRMVASQNDGDRASGDGLSDRALDLRVCPLRIGRDDCGVAEVDDPELCEGVDLRFEMRPGRTAGCPDRARAETRSGPIGDEVVRRRADHRNVDTGELGDVLVYGMPA